MIFVPRKRLWLPPRYRRGMIGLGGMTGCDCDACCILFSDDFQRANSSTMGGSWQEDGDWEIDSGKALCTSDNATLLLGSVPDEPYVKLTATVSGNEDDTLTLILNWQDSSNYTGLMLKIGELRFAKLFVVSGGGMTAMNGEFLFSTAGTGYQMTICQGSNGDLKGTIIGGGIIKTFALRYAGVPGSQVGISTKATGEPGGGQGEAARFDDVTLERVSTNCEECANCPSCPGGSANSLWIDATWSDPVESGRSGLFELRRAFGLGTNDDFMCCWFSNFSLVGGEPSKWYFASFRPQVDQESSPGSIVIGSVDYIPPGPGGSGLTYTHFVKAVDSCIIDEGSPIELTEDDFIPGPPGSEGVFSNCFDDTFPFRYPSSTLTPPGTVSLQVWSDP